MLKAKESHIIWALWRSSFGGSYSETFPQMHQPSWTEQDLREATTLVVWFEAMTASISPSSNIHFTAESFLSGVKFAPVKSYPWAGCIVISKEHCYLFICICILWCPLKHTSFKLCKYIVKVKLYMSFRKAQRVHFWRCMFQIIKKKGGGIDLD